MATALTQQQQQTMNPVRPMTNRSNQWPRSIPDARQQAGREDAALPEDVCGASLSHEDSLHALDIETIPGRIGFVTLRGDFSPAIEAAARQRGLILQRVSVAELEEASVPTADVMVVHVETIDPAAVELTALVSRHPGIFVLVVGRDRDPQHIADIFRVGADDYLPEPFASEELLVRIQALILRARQLHVRPGEERVIFDFASRSVAWRSRIVTFTGREWQLLISLLEADGKPLNVEELSYVPGEARLPPTSVASLISRLRRKLQAHGVDALDIVNVRGQGYAIRLRLGDPRT